MRKLLNEGLDHKDMVNQIQPMLTIDEYSAKSGSDANLITLAFTLKSKQAAEDLVDWFYHGYDWIVDAQVSDGEVSPGKYLVFVEINRRTNAPGRIVELIEDLETLTDLDSEEWTIEIDDKEYAAVEEEIGPHIIQSPHLYREQFPEEDSEDTETEKDSELSEMRIQAGLELPKKYNGKKDSILQDYLAKAGL